MLRGWAGRKQEGRPKSRILSIDPRIPTCKRMPRRGRAISSRFFASAAAIILAASASAAAQTERPQGIPDCFQYKTLKQAGGQNYPYLLYLPAQYDDDKDHLWPVIITLHGSGECGNVAKMADMALPRFVASRPQKFPFIVVAVNTPTMWYRGKNAAAVLEILDEVAAGHRTDPDRIYLTGYSMGGYGTWELAIARPDLFAAIIPVCGAGIPAAAGNLATLPTWAFHGALDPNVPVAGSRLMITGMKAAGAHARYTEYPSLGHEIWEGVYSSMSVYKWLLEQRRPPPPKVIDYTLVTPIARSWWLTLVVEAGAPAAHVHAEIKDDGRINITTTGVGQWIIESKAPPLVPGQAIEVHWNGVPAYKGAFKGSFGLQATTRPAEHPHVPTSRPAKQ